MQVLIQGKHLDIGDAFRTYIEDKMQETCTKYFNHTIQGDVHLIKDVGSHLYRSDITAGRRQRHRLARGGRRVRAVSGL